MQTSLPVDTNGLQTKSAEPRAAATGCGLKVAGNRLKFRRFLAKLEPGIPSLPLEVLFCRLLRELQAQSGQSLSFVCITHDLRAGVAHFFDRFLAVAWVNVYRTHGVGQGLYSKTFA